MSGKLLAVRAPYGAQLFLPTCPHPGVQRREQPGSFLSLTITCAGQETGQMNVKISLL